MRRAATAADYSRRLMRVTEHIGANLDRRVELDELAKIACFSTFHFHRIYRAVMGETVHETGTRLRLQRAAGDLRSTERQMNEIARRAGYGSVAAFTRAFRTYYGAPPGAFRASEMGTEATGPTSGAGPILSAVEIRQLAPTRVIALRYVGAYPEIGRGFEMLRAWANPRGVIRSGAGALAVFYDDPAAVPEAELRADVCMMAGPEVEGDDLVRVTEIPGGRHAVLTYRGPYAGGEGPFQALFGQWLPASGEEPADTPHFERYMNDPMLNPPSELVTEVCLPLK